jgi:hypothetical protein
MRDNSEIRNVFCGEGSVRAGMESLSDFIPGQDQLCAEFMSIKYGNVFCKSE